MPITTANGNEAGPADEEDGAGGSSGNAFPAYDPRDFETVPPEAAGVGADECSLCSKQWQEGQEGWPLCDSNGCENVCCVECTVTMDLLVADLFYCPACSGAGVSAAASD